MHPNLLAYAERQAPRYTSYPTAPHFSAAVTHENVRDWLQALDPHESLSLYIHVPYCRQLCWYCGCNTYAARRDEPLTAFVDALLREIQLVADTTHARVVKEIHWGGGTPNILHPEQFRQISAQLSGSFDTTALSHHAIELDPRYVDAERAQAYADANVSRVSLGVQDLNECVQRSIGRVQSFEVVSDAVDTLRAVGIDQINIDLMYGLPNQTVDNVRDTVRRAASLRPHRIALFGYAHVPWFKKRQRLIPDAALPNATERFDQAEAAREDLEQLGYIAIGLDHFALPDDDLAIAQRAGDLGRSFQGYTVSQASALIGLGPSAISTLPNGYAQNAPEPGAWAAAISEGRLATIRGHELTQDDKLRGQLIEHIMCNFEVDLSQFGGSGRFENEISRLAPMVADNLLTIDNDILRIAPPGQPFCRLVATAFDSYADAGTARHSRAV